MILTDYILECCVDSLVSAKAAKEGGADRFELAAHLILGGMTPSKTLIQQVMELNIPTNVLLRPRFGDFCFDDYEREELIAAVRECRELGTHGIVIGALTPEGEVDRELMEQCIAEAGDMEKVFHRAFDVSRDLSKSLETIIELGFDMILTSGGEAKAIDGAQTIKKLAEQAAGRINLLVGSGVNHQNIEELANFTGLHQFHLSGKVEVDGPMRLRKDTVPMGLPIASEYSRFVTDVDLIKSAKEVLDKLSEN